MVPECILLHQRAGEVILGLIATQSDEFADVPQKRYRWGIALTAPHFEDCEETMAADHR